MNRYMEQYFEANREVLSSGGLAIFVGASGSGKTRGLQKWTEQLLEKEGATASIVDGKGGADWLDYEEEAETFINGGRNLFEIFALVESFHEMLDDDERIGSGKLDVLVVDETYSLFDISHRSVSEAILIDHMLRMLKNISQHGKQYGVQLVLSTQKANQDTMPSHLVREATAKVLFRLNRFQDEHYLRGKLDDDALKATHIPRDPMGQAIIVLNGDDGELVQF